VQRVVKGIRPSVSTLIKARIAVALPFFATTLRITNMRGMQRGMGTAADFVMRAGIRGIA
jgi:hypothetical protein